MKKSDIDYNEVFDDYISFLDLGAFDDEERRRIESDVQIRKEMSRLMKNAREAAKRDSCYYCGKKVDGFCNSHSIPQFCLKNIATEGNVQTLNAIIDNPLLEGEKGVKKAGTFQLICRECDGKIFSDYENPDNYLSQPDDQMIAQIVLKNSLKSISKRLIEIKLFEQMKGKKPDAEDVESFSDGKNYINQMDLEEYHNEYIKAKKAVEKKSRGEYYVCYYEKLNYVVPIAFQGQIAIAVDFEGNIINDIYYPNPKYEIKNINICILPLKSETVILMFVENGDKRYRKFYKQFNKLGLEDKLAALTFIIFAYSEDMYLSEKIHDEAVSNHNLCNIGRMGQDLFMIYPFIDPYKKLKQVFNLDKRVQIPNLLSEKYKLR